MTVQASNTPVLKEKRRRPNWKHEVGFLLIHLSPVLAFFSGPTLIDWAICIGLYFFRMFFITAGYHRYFAHRTFKTSRWFQFLLAFFAQTSIQKGALWWAANHRTHHKFSDTPKDPHSSKVYGFFYSHIGWIMGPDFKNTRFDLIKDFAKFPELRWLNKNHLFPALVMMLAVAGFGGWANYAVYDVSFFTGAWSALFIGFALSTVVLFHGTFSINSLMHKIGKPRYETGDESKNSLVLALVTMGEGWHNNHHYYQSSTRQGFFWWEIDPTYYVLKFLSWFGIVWNINKVPYHIKFSKNLEHAKQLLNKSRKAK